MKYENDRCESPDLPWVPFQPKIVNNVTNAYKDSKARAANRTPGGRIQDVSNLWVGSNGPLYGAVIRFQMAIVSDIEILGDDD